MRLSVLDVAAVALTAAYAVVQLRFYRAWKGTPVSVDPQPLTSTWSIVVAARNEAASIVQTVDKLLLQKAEVIVVDDHSDDATATLARQSGATVLQLGHAQLGKKAALTLGIAEASGEWIATVDADVQVPAGWLMSLEAARSADSVAVAGPVLLSPARSWFERWQALDFCGMMAITAASLQLGDFVMGNGANLAFAKTAFSAVDGYTPPKGATTAASGDDMVLLSKLQQAYPARIAFAKSVDAAVATPPRPSLQSFVQQRWRWSAKTGLNHQPSLTATLAVVYAYHVGLLLGLPAARAGGLKYSVLAGAWAAKLGCDYLLLDNASTFFGRRHLLDKSYVLQSVVHAAYVAGIGTLALLPLDFEWKGRTWSA